ncbi:MAG TPA: hypothetical protein PKZ75_06505 [Bacteroidia bacterium]|nr:hypothetical protein [Bacteroidia bacterium]
MRLFLILVFTSFSFFLFSQAGPSEKIKITINDFKSKKTLRDLIPSLPKDCNITEYQFAIDTHQLKKMITVKNDMVSSDLKSIVSEMKPGQRFFIENIKSDCKTPIKNIHIFVIF